MLKLFRSSRGIHFSELMRVYKDSLLEQGNALYPYLSEDRRLMEAEQDYYAFLSDYFNHSGGTLALWAPEGHYEAALRFEPYKDGYVIEGFETASGSRRKGYAKSLLRSVLDCLKEYGCNVVYSHIKKNNIASIKTHEACGFHKLYDYSVYLDGSIDSVCFTFVRYLI